MPSSLKVDFIGLLISKYLLYNFEMYAPVSKLRPKVLCDTPLKQRSSVTISSPFFFFSFRRTVADEKL